MTPHYRNGRKAIAVRAVTPRVVIRTFDWPLLLLAWKALARNAVRSLSLFAQRAVRAADGGSALHGKR